MFIHNSPVWLPPEIALGALKLLILGHTPRDSATGPRHLNFYELPRWISCVAPLVNLVEHWCPSQYKVCTSISLIRLYTPRAEWIELVFPSTTFLFCSMLCKSESKRTMLQESRKEDIRRYICFWSSPTFFPNYFVSTTEYLG